MALVKLDVSIAKAKAEFVIDDVEGRDYTVALALQHGLVHYEVPLPTVLMAFAQEARSAFLDIGAHTGLHEVHALIGVEVTIIKHRPMTVVESYRIRLPIGAE